MTEQSPESIFADAGGATVVSLPHARSSGAAGPDTDKPNTSGKTEKSNNLVFIDPRKLQGKPVPDRKWIVEDWLPAGCATLLFGDGGTGKTLLTQQLMTSCATGKPWSGLAVTRCRSIAIFCEDDENELHRRQDRINAAYDVDFDTLDDMTWASGMGQDNCLMRFLADGRPQRTERLAEIRDAARAHRARLVVIDTAVDTFGGNENDRAQVRGFMGAANALAMQLDGAVLINAHPSRTGLAKDGDLDGGSTAWSNSARSRWSLARPKAEGDDAVDADERVLTRRKANYASIGDAIRLKWQKGVLVPLSTPTGLAGAARASEIDTLFLELVARCNGVNMPLSNSCHAHNFAPKIFSKRTDRQGYQRKDFQAAMERLIVAGRIVLVSYGRKSDERRRLALVGEVANG